MASGGLRDMIPTIARTGVRVGGSSRWRGNPLQWQAGCRSCPAATHVLLACHAFDAGQATMGQGSLSIGVQAQK